MYFIKKEIKLLKDSHLFQHPDADCSGCGWWGARERLRCLSPRCGTSRCQRSTRRMRTHWCRPKTEKVLVGFVYNPPTLRTKGLQWAKGCSVTCCGCLHTWARALRDFKACALLHYPGSSPAFSFSNGREIRKGLRSLMRKLVCAIMLIICVILADVIIKPSSHY